MKYREFISRLDGLISKYDNPDRMEITANKIGRLSFIIMKDSERGKVVESICLNE